MIADSLIGSASSGLMTTLSNNVTAGSIKMVVTPRKTGSTSSSALIIAQGFRKGAKFPMIEAVGKPGLFPNILLKGV